MTIDDIRHANLLLLLEEVAASTTPGDRRGVVARLADLSGRSPSQISQLKTRAIHSRTGAPRNIGPDVARAFERAMNKPAGWMDVAHKSAGREQKDMQLGGTQLRGAEALVLSHRVESDSPLLVWAQLMFTDTEVRRFRAAMPDDSMAPRLRQGQIARFDRDLEARPGDAVLVQDDHGRMYVRMYRERRPGLWEAHCVNDAYQSLDSERDGLQLVAVLTGVEGRWS
jgi:hypothetical protein